MTLTRSAVMLPDTVVDSLRSSILSRNHNRLSAARDVVADGSIIFVETDTMNAEAGRIGVEQLLASPKHRRPDTVFAANDMVALGVLQALTLRGVRVPDDIAILGYDDIDFAASAAIPITSVRQPAHQMGSTAAAMLVDVIDHPAASSVRHVRFVPELIVRRSSQAD